jgi:uncharacterized protein YecE (DUF72 family)
MDVKVGVCGFCLSQAEILRRFTLMEVQQTFYWPPQVTTVERWRHDAPDGFEFTLKAFQAITHVGTSPTYRRAKLSPEQKQRCGNFADTDVVRDAWTTTLNLADALRATIAVFQCPPSFAATDENVSQMRQFFHWAPRGRLLFAWEPRHVSWTDSLISEMCRDLGLIPTGDPLEREIPPIGSPTYFRLHGMPLGKFAYDYDHPYTDQELARILRLSSQDTTYCMFNNKQMADDATRFALLANAEAMTLHR